MLIKTFKINLKLIITILIFTVLICSIFAFYSLANESENTKKDFIKWVDFNVSAEALKLTANLDIKSHNENQEIKYNWIELLSYLACTLCNRQSRDAAFAYRTNKRRHFFPFGGNFLLILRFFPCMMKKTRFVFRRANSNSFHGGKICQTISAPSARPPSFPRFRR